MWWKAGREQSRSEVSFDHNVQESTPASAISLMREAQVTAGDMRRMAKRAGVRGDQHCVRIMLAAEPNRM
jgi:hypothetical protein